MSGNAEELAARTERLSGSTIPLSEAVRLVLQQLEQSPSGVGETAAALRASRLLELNRARITATWGTGRQKADSRRADRTTRSWKVPSEGLARDILAQLEHIGLASCNEDGTWELAGDFDPYRRYTLLMRDGKVISYVCLRESETRVIAGKLSEARFMLTAAHNLVREAGVESQMVDEFFAGLQRVLAPGQIDKTMTEKRRGNKSRLITPDQLPDRPDLLVACSKCGDRKEPKPLTREYYEQYWSKGAWYWRADCKECHRAVIMAGKGRAVTWTNPEHVEKVRLAVLGLTEENGEVPSRIEVRDETGLHHLTVLSAWKYLAAEDEDFPRVPPGGKRKELAREARERT